MKIFNVIYNVFAIIIVLVFLFTTFVALSGTEVFAVATPSMEPTIGEGSAVFVRSANSYSAGDIITAQLSNGNTFTHRIVQVDGDMVYTKGDANAQPDPQPTDSSLIVGKVLFSVPHLGSLSLSFNGQTLTLVLSAVLLLLILIRFIVTKIKKPKEETANEKA